MKVRELQLCFLMSFVTCGLLYQLDEIKYFKQSEAYLVENSLQPSEQDVPLEEFFWTGSGDGPSYIKPKESQGNDGKYPNTVVRTATILATVYIDGNYDSELDPLCIYDCDKKFGNDGVVESIDNISPTDRRYWLLTVVAGLFSPQDFPILEEKLAKLYRIAFLRQQYKHLGIAKGNETVFNQTDHAIRKRSNDVISPTKTLTDSQLVQTRKFEINQYVYERQVSRMKRQRTHVRKRDSLTAPPIAQKLPYEIIFNDSSRKFQKSNQNVMQKVRITIHDLVHGDQEDKNIDTNKIDVPMEKNQTEIIYSVIIGGKPVLALTAAEDMRLVKIDEVAKILENDIFLKAEPYLKEAPQATPLSPSYMNGSNTVTTYVDQNPLLIALTSVAFILFILLLITLLLYGRSKRRLATETKRQSATQALVQKINVDDDINTIHSDSLQGVGVDNLAFEKDGSKKEPPILHFPLPPPNRPSSNTSTTSDSSIYYPKRRYKFNSVQDLLNAKDGKHDDNDELYMKIQSTGKASTKALKQQRRGRKYKTDNRVGSIEQADVHSNQSDGLNEDSLIPYQEHNEAFNPNVSHYNSNKIMADKAFSIVESERKRTGRSKAGKNESTAEAINKELIQRRRGRVTSADSNSIGSFLSMASIRSFPKCTVPEPLSRVLEPVSVCHLDHSDADTRDSLKNYSRMMDSQKSLDLDEDLELENRTQSDGADPGVVGPVVWEMHKKGFELSTNSLSSPQHDPHATRNRFEGLLEGAMKLYSSSSYTNCNSLQQDEDQLGQMPGLIKSKENRGKSAATIRLTSRTSGLLSRTDFNPARPLTADPQQIQNPVPTIRAWSGSNIVRPLSAGVYHKPNLSPPLMSETTAQIERTRAMSASPIIDAIQKELKRISND